MVHNYSLRAKPSVVPLIIVKHDACWRCVISSLKCNILHLARQVAKPVRFYTLGGEVFSSVSEAKYLGVTLSNNYGTWTSQWKSHILDTISKASQKFVFLYRNLKQGVQPWALTKFPDFSLTFPWPFCGFPWPWDILSAFHYCLTTNFASNLTNHSPKVAITK